MTGRVAKTVLLVVVLGLGVWLTARALRPVAPAQVGADVVLSLIHI